PHQRAYAAPLAVACLTRESVTRRPVPHGRVDALSFGIIIRPGRLDGVTLEGGPILGPGSAWDPPVRSAAATTNRRRRASRVAVACATSSAWLWRMRAHQSPRHHDRRP